MNDRRDPVSDDTDVFSQPDAIDAYCVTCRQTVPMDHPEPVWTRRGSAATRGECPVCGTTVFRIGRTPAHDTLERPAPVRVGERPAGKLAAETVFVNYSVADAGFAEQLAADLNRIGVPTFMAEDTAGDVRWATGVHPALVECKRMIVVLSPLAAQTASVVEAWEFFEQRRKPIVVAQAAPADLPDALRRKPRFDFAGADYKRAFRELVQALTRR